MSSERAAHATLRIGAAFAFLYPPVRALFDPISWLGYFPPFIHALPIDPLTLLYAFSVLEVALALWVLSGRAIRVPAACMTLLLLAIVAFNANQMDVVFRDISIALMTFALALWPEPLATQT